MTDYIWLAQGVQLYKHIPVPIGGLKCSYCSGVLIGLLRNELIRKKRQPPVGAIDMHIYDEEKQTHVDYICSNCKGISKEHSSGNVLPCQQCRKQVIWPSFALTWPELPIQLSLKHDDSDSISRSLSRCTLCVKCYVCEQGVNSRNIVDAKLLTNHQSMASARVDTEHYYAHAQCAEQLLPTILATHQKELENHKPRKSSWWKRF